MAKKPEAETDEGGAGGKISPVQRVLAMTSGLGPKLAATAGRVKALIPSKKAAGDFDATIEAAKSEDDWPDESEIPRARSGALGRFKGLGGRFSLGDGEDRPARPWPLVATWLLLVMALGGAGTWLYMASHKLDTVPGTAVVIEVPRRTMAGNASDPFAAASEGTKETAKEETAEQPEKPKTLQRRILPSGMIAAPDPGLHQTGGEDFLPIVTPDGRSVSKVYAAPFSDPLNRPRIAIVLVDMGLNQSATIAAIQRLPPAITFAFSPYVGNAGEQSEAARAAGHEVLVQLPMEPNEYPASDPGPYAVMTGYKPDENLRRIEWVLGRFAGYVGAINYMGSKLTASPEELRPALEALKLRGLLFVDTRATQRSLVGRLSRELGLPVALNNRFVDTEVSKAAIDARLEDLERLAKTNGVAVGIARPYPATIDRLEKWSQAVGPRNIALAPISAVVGKQRVE